MLDSIVRIFAPFSCMGCGKETDRLICEACLRTIPRVPSRCYLCKATTRQYAVCERCKRRTPLRHVVVWAPHEGLPKELIHVAKYERAKAGLHEIAEVLADSLPLFGRDIILTHLPTASSRIRERGYDQARIISRKLARRARLPYTSLLARLGQVHQVGSTRKERIVQMSDAFRSVREANIKGAHVVIVDDVCTMGASLEAAARALKRAGAKQVDAIVFTQP